MGNRRSGWSGTLVLSAFLVLLPAWGASGEFPWVRQAPERVASPSGNIVYRPIYALPPARALYPSVYGRSSDPQCPPGLPYTPTGFGGRRWGHGRHGSGASPSPQARW
jgi:hypothetical protein